MNGKVRAVFLLWRWLTISEKEVQINEEIRDKEIRVIGPDGAQIGILSAAEAQKMANAQNLDLVKIAPQATPPVCKIMDYGKYRFEQMKKEKESRKNQRTVDIKEIRLSLNIDTNDFNTKINHAKKFLKSGNRVKVSIKFRGREMAHTELGKDVMQKAAAALSEFGVIDKAPKLEGRNMLMFVSAKPSK